VGVDLLHVSGDGLELVGDGGDGLGEDLAGDLVGCGSRSNLSGGRVVDETLLGLTVTSWEEDELGLVGVESLGVKLELLFTSGCSPVINSNTNSAAEGGAELRGLDLGESETTAVSDLTSVPSCA